MTLFQDFLDQSKQCNRASQRSYESLPYHPPNKKYKIIHNALIIPNLPAPLHYLNFHSLIGQPNSPIFQNNSSSQSHGVDIATVLASTSAQMVGHLHTYSIQNECSFLQDKFQFSDREQITGHFPEFFVEREDSELSFKLKITTTNTISHFLKIRMSLAEYWSSLCFCEGEVIYKQQKIHIKQIGSFEYARMVNFPYVSYAFFTYQIINLENNRQLLCMQIRNETNQILQSRMYLKDGVKGQTEMFEDNVAFNVDRVYPKIKTPNGQHMYLPREFSWACLDHDGCGILVVAQSRGDFKFGVGAGYVGSFSYSVKINNQEEIGEGGYCEYIDCRSLRWQEQNKDDEIYNSNANFVPFMAKR